MWDLNRLYLMWDVMNNHKAGKTILRLSFIHENLEIADDKLQTMREY